VFRIREVARTWVIILMGACVGAAPALAGPVEARCTELGAQCLCSEPLRYTAAGTLFESVDPPDSEGAGAKECNGGLAIDAEPTGMQLVNVVDGASGLDFPGPNPPARVLKMTSVANDGNNGWQVIGNQPTGVRNETICGRTYQRFGADLPNPAREPMRIKMSQAGVGFEIHHDGLSNDSGLYDIRVEGECTGSHDMLAAARTSWIRHEFCLDFGTTTVGRRGRVTVVDTGVADTLLCGSVPVSTPANFDDFLIGNLFLQTMGNPAYFGSRYVTHAIQTRGPLNTSFWPGAATEIEGGAGAPPPPPTQGTLGKPGQPYYTP